MSALIPTILGTANPLHHWDEFQRIWQDRSGQVYLPFLPVLLAVVAVIAAVLAALWLWERRRQQELRSHPLAVFHQIAREMGLSLKDQWLLTRIARAADLPTPLTLLLSADTLVHHSSQYGRDLSKRRLTLFNNRVDRIRVILAGP
jgi:hypothetical protein